MLHRILCLLLGYGFGNILTAEIVVRKIRGKSVFSIGTGNPGMANVMAQCGFVPGILVLAGDLLKTVIPCVLCRFLLFPAGGAASAAWAGLGCILGHNFPVWNRGKGGKGVSCTCAAIFCIHPLFGLLAMIVGMLAVFATKYLAIGAVLIPLAFLPMAAVLFGTETAVLVAVMALVMFTRHAEGLKKIPGGTEKQVDVLGLIREKIRKK